MVQHMQINIIIEFFHSKHTRGVGGGTPIIVLIHEVLKPCSTVKLQGLSTAVSFPEYMNPGVEMVTNGTQAISHFRNVSQKNNTQSP